MKYQKELEQMMLEVYREDFLSEEENLEIIRDSMKDQLVLIHEGIDDMLSIGISLEEVFKTIRTILIATKIKRT